MSCKRSFFSLLSFVLLIASFTASSKSLEMYEGATTECNLINTLSKAYLKLSYQNKDIRVDSINYEDPIKTLGNDVFNALTNDGEKPIDPVSFILFSQAMVNGKELYDAVNEGKEEEKLDLILANQKLNCFYRAGFSLKELRTFWKESNN